MEKNPQPFVTVLVVLMVLALVIGILSRKKKGTITTIEKYRAKIDTAAYFAMRSDQFEYGWNPDFSRPAKTFKAGEIIGDAVGYFPTTNQNGKEFTFMVFEQPFLYGTTVFVCINKANLSLIQ